MIIQGILDNSLNGQLCIRGFANIKELARVSEADYAYQRGLIDRSDISDFLETQTYLFFPEIILSYKFKHKTGDAADTPLKLIQEGKRYKSKIDGAEAVVKTVHFPKDGSRDVKVVELELDDSHGKLFHRIDGNHRLNAAEKSESEKVERMMVPFCLLLGTDFYDGNRLIENKETRDFDKAVKVFFHNINTKTIPLTSEENLKVMIDDAENFPDAELKDIFGGDFPIKTRELISSVRPDIFGSIGHIISENYRTYYNDIFNRQLGPEGATPTVNDVIQSLQAINTLYKENDELRSNRSYGILTAFLYYHLQGESTKFARFKDWILNNHIFKVNEVTADSLIGIFDNIVASQIRIFVAMPYFSTQEVEEYNKIYSDTVKQVADDYGMPISVYPIMSNQGATSDQIQDIINKIQESNIIFADITDNNANVLYEMGWARALNKDVVIVRRKGSEKPKSDYQNDTYHEYDDKARSISLGRVIKENLLEILEKNFGLVRRG